MFKDTDYDNFPFIISSGLDFQYEINSIKHKMIPKIEMIFNSTKHISLKAYDTVYNTSKSVEIRPKELNNFGLINLDAISQNGSFCICLLGEKFEDLFAIMSASDPVDQDATHFQNKVKDSISAAAKSGYQWIDDEFSGKDSSLLELLSMQAGLMAKVKFPLFYFRVSGGPISDRDQTVIGDPWSEQLDDDANPRMERLKQKLIRNGLPIRFYGSATEFDDIVENDLTNIINANYPSKTKERDDFLVDQQCFEKQKLKSFTRNDAIDRTVADLDCFYSSLFQWTPPTEQSPDLDRIDTAIRDCYRKDFSDKLQSALNKMRSKVATESSSPCEHQRILIIAGSRCSGKSTILANWISYKEDKSIVLLVHYCEASSVSSDLRAMIRRLIQSIRSQCGYEVDRDSVQSTSLDSDIRHLSQELFGAMLLSQRIGIKLLIVIDGLDHLGDRHVHSSHKIKDVHWIPDTIPDNVRLILTCAASDYSFLRLQHSRDDVKVVRIDAGETASENDQGIRCAMDGLSALVGDYGQICSESLLRNVTDWPLLCNPLVQKIVAHVYHTLGQTGDWDPFLENISECHSIVELIRRVLRLCISFLNWEIVTVNEKSLKKKYNQRKDEKAEEDSFVKGWIPDCLSLIVLTRSGLFIDSIPSLLRKLGYVKELEVTESDIWTLFHLTQGFMLKYHKARLEFSQSLCKEIVAHTFLAIANCGSVEASTQESNDSMYTDKRCKLHTLLANLFWTRQGDQDENLEECVYHLDKASDYQSLANVIFHPRILLCLFDLRWEDLSRWLGQLKSVHKFHYYLQLLCKHGYDLVGRIRHIVAQYYQIVMDDDVDIVLTGLQARNNDASGGVSRSDTKSSFHSDFVRKLRINYRPSDEKNIFLSFSTDQSMRYLFLLGQVASLMKQNGLARKIYAHIVKTSEDKVLVCHVMWCEISMTRCNPTGIDQDSDVPSALSILNDLSTKIVDDETDLHKIDSIMYLRCMCLVEQCSSAMNRDYDVIIRDRLAEVRSLASCVRSVILDSRLLDLECEWMDRITSSDDRSTSANTTNAADSMDGRQRRLYLMAKSIVTMETWSGPMDLSLARLWMNLGLCLWHGNYQFRLKSEACCRRALSIWNTVRDLDNVHKDSNNGLTSYLSEEENSCCELLLSLLLHDICHCTVAEAKNLLFKMYDSRVKSLGCDHADTKRLAPLIKAVSSLDLQLQHQSSTSAAAKDLDRRSLDRVVHQCLALSRNQSNQCQDHLTKWTREARPSNVMAGQTITATSLQFVNKFNGQMDLFQEDIDWDVVLEQNVHRSRSCTGSVLSSRRMRSDLLSCDSANILMRGSSAFSTTGTIPRHLYSGHNSSLSYDDRRLRRHSTTQTRTSFRNVTDRQQISDAIRAKLSQLDVSKGRNWLPRKKSFSATFCRPYYSVNDPMMT